MMGCSSYVREPDLVEKIVNFINFIPDLVPFFSWFLTIYSYRFILPNLGDFCNGSRSGRHLSARSGSFLKVPNLADIFLPDLVPFLKYQIL